MKQTNKSTLDHRSLRRYRYYMTQTRTSLKLSPSELFAWTCYNILHALQHTSHIHDEPLIPSNPLIHQDTVESIQADWIHLTLNKTPIIIDAIVPNNNDAYGVYGEKFNSNDQIIYVMAPSYFSSEAARRHANGIVNTLGIDKPQNT